MAELIRPPLAPETPQTETQPARVGVEPVRTVVMMEDHDGALYAWQDARVRGRVLLHIDGHLDWGWMPDKEPLELLEARTLDQVEALLSEPWLWNVTARRTADLLHIGNYIYPALRDGLIREFYWVLPDAALEPRGLRSLLRMFDQLRALNPRRFQNLRAGPGGIGCEIDGRRVTACRLSELPPIEEPVLLDIDTDFLVNDPAETIQAGQDPWRQLPWMWPAGLLEGLKQNGIRTDLVTIAYSVEGGFTPLIYKYLGDELALRLKHPVLPSADRARLAHHRQAAADRSEKRFDEAIAEYEEALELAPDDAACHFNLAYLHDQREQHTAAAARYRQAVALDPSYATEFNSFGSVYESLGLLEKARREYERILRWDPQNPNALYGLARVMTRSKRWEEALAAYRTVEALRPGQAKVHRSLGSLHAELGRWADAISEWEQALALNGQDGPSHFWLGRAYSRTRRWDEAIAAYRAALRCGLRIAPVYFGLGRLYLRTARLGPAWNYTAKGLRRWVRTTAGALRARGRRLFDAVQSTRWP